VLSISDASEDQHPVRRRGALGAIGRVVEDE
jgi:hypothetical protein